MPSVGDLVIGTVKKIFDYGAYLSLDEYGGHEAYLPWSEVSSKWVKDIRDFLREGQKVVVKVIRVDRRRGHVDVSLKRVNATEQRRKMLEFKRAQRAEKMLEIVAKKLGKTLDEAYDKVGWRLEDYYGEIFYGMEEAAYRGEEALREAGVPEEWISPLMEEIRKHIKIKKVKIRGIVTLMSTAPDGIERIRSAFLKPLKKINTPADTKVRVYTIGAPRYRVEVVSTDYKKAERILAEYIKGIQKYANHYKMIFAFTREKG